jgi:hypothetical protein
MTTCTFCGSSEGIVSGLGLPNGSGCCGVCLAKIQRLRPEHFFPIEGTPEPGAYLEGNSGTVVEGPLMNICTECGGEAGFHYDSCSRRQDVNASRPILEGFLGC